MKEAGILFIKNLANLLKVKTILSLAVIFTTCVLTFKNNYSKKNCPHRTMKLGWDRFLNMVKSYLEDKPVDNNIEKGSDEPVRTYQNGSTSENVYADTNCTKKIGSLNPRESCDCFGIFNNRAMVRYPVSGTNNFKIGFCKWLGGVK